MNKDKELELKVQMFCAAIGQSDGNSYTVMTKVAYNVDEAFKVLKHQDEKG